MKLTKRHNDAVRTVVNRMWNHQTGFVLASEDKLPLPCQSTAAPMISAIVEREVRRRLRFYAQELNQLLEPNEKVKL